MALAGVYAIVGLFGLSFSPVHVFASLVWPPTGIALAALLLGGTGLWPGVLLGALVVNLWNGAPALAAAAIGAGNTLEAVVGAHLVGRIAGREPTLDRIRSALAFVVLGALLSTTISATVGVASLSLAGLVPRADAAVTWRAWWLGDAVGALVVGALLLAWRAPPRRPLDRRGLAHAAAFVACAIAAAAFVFLHTPVAAASGFVQACLLIPLLTWAALRFEARGATAAVFLTSAIAVAGTALGRGPFVQELLSDSLLYLQGFMAIVAAAALLAGAVTAERADAMRRCARGDAEARGLAETLREADRRKSEFLGVLSHELRNPLAPIRNALHILRRAPAGSDHAARAMAVIERQTGQLTRLVDDLLDVTRISQGKIRLRRERVDLADLVRHAVEDHRPVLDGRGVALAATLDAGPLWIDADAARVTQVIGNLLQNSAKFTNPGGHVGVGVVRAGERATLRVADDGIGIAPDVLPSIFEPFTQADRSLDRSLGGLGLGLALVKALVEMHGGQVGAASAGLGRGAEFTVSLPLVADEARAREPRAAPRGAAGPRRVLVIDDNADAAEMLGEALAMSGHEVAVAHGGEEGLAKVGAFEPDVVICDIGLPGLSGYEVARRIRAMRGRSPTLIALTGYALPHDQATALAAGFDHHLAKPLEFAALEAVLARAVPRPADDGDVSRPAP